jgi:hypothetical protein
VGARTDAARAEVLAARAGLDEELVRLEASGRAAVDIPARLKREPAKVLGTAGGAAFLLLGGPRRVFQGARRAVMGPKADMPKSMLPKEVDKELKKLGDDGERVRRTLEREFANYLDEKADQRKERDLGAMLALLLGGVAKPVVQRFGKQLAEQALSSDSSTFAESLRRARERTTRNGSAGSATKAESAATRAGVTPPPGGPDEAPL